MGVMNMHTIIYYIREYFFPNGCGGCGVALMTAEDSMNGLCVKCRALFESAFSDCKRCAYCGKYLISEKSTCLFCRKNEENEKEQYSDQLIKIHSSFPYMGNYKRVLSAYKFGKSLGIGNFLSGFFPRALLELGISTGDLGPAALSKTAEGSSPCVCAWVPVPPRPGKIRKQGWDQVEFLAKQLETRHRQKVSRCLKRLPSRSQKELNRDERGSNLKGRIICVKPPPKTAILFDDVITTGATLAACAKALLDGGTEKVYGVCLFYD